MYCGITPVPEAYSGNGDLMTFNENAGFWVFNQVTNFAYTRTSLLLDDLQNKQKELEDSFISETRTIIDTHAASSIQENPKRPLNTLLNIR